MGRVMMEAIAGNNMKVRAEAKKHPFFRNVTDNGPPTARPGPGSASIGHTAEEHGPTTNVLDAPAGPERQAVRIQKKSGSSLGLGGRGGQRNRNGGGLNIGGY